MVIIIKSNADLPKCLNTESKQAKWAKQLANSHTGIPAKKARGPRIQGFFSRTMIVTLQNCEDIVIQFRPEVLDMEPFQVARQVLGPVVPDIGLLEDEDLKRVGIWAYWMTYMPGKTWLEAIAGKCSQPVVTINKSLGRILSQGHIKDSSSDHVVDTKLRPHLELLLSSEHNQVEPFKAVARDLLAELAHLKNLPLFVSHFDLNEMNIMVDDKFQVSGLIDWELSSPLPFGMGFSRIHTLAGEFSDGEFYMPEEFEESERAFWQEIFYGIPGDVREVLDANVSAVQTAVLLGTLLGTFELEEGKLAGPFNSVSVKALPKFLSYRVPLLRGSDPPYAK